MESDITVFLEFYGLPGCGKSTISHLVAEELRKQGKKVAEPTYDVDHKYVGGKRKAIKLLKLVRYAFVHPKECVRMLKLINDNGYSWAEVVSHAANVAQKLWEYEHAHSDYVVFDEGLTQSAISLSKGQKNSAENEISLYSFGKKRIVRKFYIKVDLKTALERMACRDKHDSRIEKIKDTTEQKNAIMLFEEQCNIISSGFIVDEKTVEDSIKSVMRQI